MFAEQKYIVGCMMRSVGLVFANLLFLSFFETFSTLIAFLNPNMFSNSMTAFVAEFETRPHWSDARPLSSFYLTERSVVASLPVLHLK
jgi:hypothetical protein